MRPQAKPLVTDTVGYVRVSTEDQAAERKTSLRDQRVAVEQLAGRLGRQLVEGAVFSDPGVSGGSAESRPGFMALIRYAQQHPQRSGLVLVLNESRWGRFPNPEEGAYWRVTLEKLGWKVRYVEGDESQAIEVHAIMRSVHATTASIYRENLRANARRAARSTAAKGLWQNEAPFGYRRCAARPGQEGRVLEPGQRKAEDEQTRLVPGPAAEQELVREAFRAYADDGVTLLELARRLRERWPARPWSRPAIAVMLRNPAYVGDVVWCRKANGAKGQERTPADSWVVVRDAHLALVDRALFRQAAARLEANRLQTRATHCAYPLAHLVRCGQCGQPLVGGGGPRGPAEDPERFRFYRDAGGGDHDIRPKVCAGPMLTIRKKWIERAVIQEIAAVVGTPAVQARIAKELDERLSSRHGGQAQKLSELERGRRQRLRERDRLVAAVARGVVSDREAAATLQQLRDELDATSSAIERLRFAGRQLQLDQAERARLLALGADFAGLAARASGAQLKRLIEPWLYRAVIDKAKRVLVLEIRTLPAVAPFAVVTSAGAEATTGKTRPAVIRRVLPIPPRGGNHDPKWRVA